MPKLKPGTIIPTQEEDAAITAGITADEDARELDATWFKEAKPASKVLPSIMGEEAADVMLKRRGRRPGTNNKVATSVRFDNDLLDAFKATGDGWQTRMNDALRDWAKKHHMLPR
jgi:uncharacterized protein (DUF4415 family)